MFLRQFLLGVVERAMEKEEHIGTNAVQRPPVSRGNNTPRHGGIEKQHRTSRDAALDRNLEGFVVPDEEGSRRRPGTGPLSTEEAIRLFIYTVLCRAVDRQFKSMFTEEVYFSAFEKISRTLNSAKNKFTRNLEVHEHEKEIKRFDYDLKTLPLMKTSRLDDEDKHYGSQCQVCMKKGHPAKFKIALDGYRYSAGHVNGEGYQGMFTYNRDNEKTSVTYYAGDSCTVRVSNYHVIQHFKHMLTNYMIRTVGALYEDEFDKREQRRPRGSRRTDLSSAEKQKLARDDEHIAQKVFDEVGDIALKRNINNPDTAVGLWYKRYKSYTEK